MIGFRKYIRAQTHGEIVQTSDDFTAAVMDFFIEDMGEI